MIIWCCVTKRHTQIFVVINAHEYIHINTHMHTHKYTLTHTYTGHSTELVQSQVGNILKICMFYSQNFVRIYIVPYLKYTYLVNEPSIFILYFQNVLECFSSPKNCHYRNIVINYSKNVLLLTCSDCVSFPSLKSIFTNIS